MVKKNIILIIFLICGSGIRAFSQLYINEILAANASVNFDRVYYNFSAWVEIYNSGTDTVAMKKFYLSDDSLQPGKWQFPDIALLPKEYLLVWADKNDTALHSTFSLDAEGEFIGLYDSLKKPVDTITFGKQYPNVSLGRTPADSSVWKYYGYPTPAAANSTEAGTLLASLPLFSLRGGYYPSSRLLSITCSSPTAKIYYTTDGNEPDEKSTLYTAPINISSTTIVRARTYDPGMIPSEMVTRSYFINDQSSLPIVSVSVPPKFLWDDTIGIYTEGKNGISIGWGSHPANYNRPWERAANVEFFEKPDSASFRAYCGIEIYGSASRSFAQKALDVKIKDKYGAGKVKFKLFNDRDYNNIHSFILRNSGNDWQDYTGGYGYGLMFRDGMINVFASGQMDIDYMAYRPCIVYINGQFWGISDLREKEDKYYCNNNFPLVDKDSVDILKQQISKKFEVQEGTDTLLRKFLASVQTRNFAIDSNYSWIKDSIDIREFINYLIVETYANNLDWTINNIKIWRQKGLVKWRWMLYDLDFGFNGFGDVYNDMIDNAYNIGKNPNSTILLYHLINNTGFKNEFAQTYAAHMNITYQPKRIHYIMDSIANLVRPEVVRHSERWKAEGSIQSLASWNQHLNFARSFINARPAVQWNHLKGFLGFYDMSNLCIRRSDPDKGMVYVQGATLCDSFNLGSYFNHIPVELQAVPLNGYYFIWWEIKKKGKITHNKNLFLTDTINTSGIYDTVFYTAVFRKSPTDTFPPPPLIIPVQPPPPGSITFNNDNAVPAIYPNPVQDNLYIHYMGEESGRIKVISVQGIVCHEQTIREGITEFDASVLPPGFYNILFTSGKGFSVQHFIKQ